MDDFYYRKLKVYQRALLLVPKVYALTRNFPTYEQHGLTDQLQRAVVSISSNIAEGMGRNSIKERIHFAGFAKGSLFETMCQIEIAQILNYITKEEMISCETEISEISRMMTGLNKALEEKS